MNQPVRVAAVSVCTAVSGKQLKALLETSGEGTYVDDHPWLVARDLFTAAQDAGERTPLLLAVNNPYRFSHWAFITGIEVVELHRAAFESRIRFERLAPVNPIWEPLDSVYLQPTAERLLREQHEGVHQHRYPLTVAEIFPYGLIETPAFVAVVAN